MDTPPFVMPSVVFAKDYAEPYAGPAVAQITGDMKAMDIVITVASLRRPAGEQKAGG